MPSPLAGPPVGRPCRILASPKRIALNPYFATISGGLERRGWPVEDFTYIRGFLGGFDILHVHFPAFPFNNRRLWITAARLLLFVSIVALSQARGKRVVWTVHNLAHHEGYYPALEKMFMNWFADRVDLTVHLSESGRAAAMGTTGLHDQGFVAPDPIPVAGPTAWGPIWPGFLPSRFS